MPVSSPCASSRWSSLEGAPRHPKELPRLRPDLFALAGPHHLRTPDLLVVAAYLVLITLLGLRFRERPGAAVSLRSYFLASNTIPWWAIALSVVSAETSTLTIISIPGVAFAGDLGFLQVVLGYMLGRVVVAVVFLPRYFAGQMLTAYQLIEARFGSFLHKVTAGLFLLTRAAAEGVRVFAISIVVGISVGTGSVLSIGIICLLTLTYTFEGGMAAVIWTDVVQMCVYIVGTLTAVLSLGHSVTGGWHVILHQASAAGKLQVFHFGLDLTHSYTFWAGLLGGSALTMASHGTDQLMVQRLLAARNLRASQLALLSSGLVILLQFALFLVIGVGLWVFYQHSAAAAGVASNDALFPTFIARQMPTGIAGLLVAAILAAAMSNLSAALNSLSSTTVIDFFIPLRPHSSTGQRALLSKASTAAWAIVLFALAVYSARVGGKGHVVEIGLSIASVAYGSLLGVFLLGTLTRSATQWGAALGMLCGFALNVWLWQGVFPAHIGPLTIPHIAFTWFVLFGAATTFAVGLLASFARRRQLVVTLLLVLALPATASASQPDFNEVSRLVQDAIAAHKLPGAVVIVGHNGHIVFHRAYGLRKLAGQPGLHANSAAEPMTEDTIFDMASLTKVLATTTAVLQLYQAGKLSLDAPLETYLPAFNPQHDPVRAQVTLRLLLTHFSGEPPDISLADPWGLDGMRDQHALPGSRAEGLHRALTAPLASAPGETFRYSDINFLLLGTLVERLTGQREDLYVQQHVFAPLKMKHTRYLALDEGCGRPYAGHPGEWASPCARGSWRYTGHPGEWASPCARGSWRYTGWLPHIAPTAHDDEGTPSTNPDYGQLLRGTVHDPTARRMGGVAGHAGLFSTAHDTALFAQALLQRLTQGTGSFPLTQQTLQLATTPQQPNHSLAQLTAAAQATDSKVSPNDPLLAPSYPAIAGQTLRGLGWDIDSAYSKPRGRIFPIGSFGHTGFTGTSVWMDPRSGTYVVLLANAVHPVVGPAISQLRGDVASAAAQALSSAGSRH